MPLALSEAIWSKSLARNNKNLLVFSSSKAEKDFGFRTHYSLEDGI